GIHFRVEYLRQSLELIDIISGECFGLLGPNGCGKTTLINILCGMLPQTSGSVKINGVDSCAYLKKNPSFIGLAPQEYAFYPSLTVRENCNWFATLYGLTGKNKRKRVEHCLEFSGLKEHADMPVVKFSGGMKRRANLAITLVNEPKFLILDEPTVNVDPQSRNMIFEMFAELKRKGTTMLYTTHYMEEAETLCDRVAIVDDGRVLECAPPQELIDMTAGAGDLGDVFLRLTGHGLRD
ncbi:MAG: ABC transporter ATP-binding protein, partial [Candidatus Thioglobus sp.]